MKNPRLKISNNIRLLNNNKSCFSKNYFNFSYFPEPFIWDKKAPIYILLANPWRIEKENEENEIELLNNDINLKKIVLNNIKWNWLQNEYPFHYLDNKFEKTWWYKWWNKCFKYLLSNEKIDKLKLSKNIFCLEIYWYHSYKFKIDNNIKKSDEVQYSIYLLNKAIEEWKIIILSRSVNNWFNLVPKLRNYNNCHFLATNRVVEIRNTTLSPNAYNEILRILK